MITFSNKIVQNDIKDIVSRNIEWDKLRNHTVLITGANGMLATYMVYTLMYLNKELNYNTKIVALVRNENKARSKFEGCLDSDLFTLLVQDVCFPIDIQADIDYIIHAAGNASPKFIVSDPVGIIKANSIGTMNVLELAKTKNVKNVLYTSTREVYGKMPEGTTEIHESDCGAMNCKELRACYPESKRISETMLESYYFQYKVPFTTVRIAHSYGPGMEINQDGRVMSDFISDIVNNKNITLKSDGSAVRAFCYINDAIAGIFMVLLQGEIGEVYNIANESEPIMIRDVAKELTGLFPERGVRVIFDILKEQSLGYSKMGRVKLDTSKLENLGWSCNIKLKDGLYKTVRSFELSKIKIEESIRNV